MESAAGLVGLVVEFTSGVQGGEDDPLCGDAFFMHLHRNAAAVVLHGAGAVGLQRHPDAGALSRQMLVHRVINNLIYQMIESLGPHAADIHAGALAHGLQALKHGNAVRIIL